MKKLFALVALFTLLLGFCVTPAQAAPVNLTGWETGDSSESFSTTGTFSVQTSIVHTGTYALRVNPSGAAQGSESFRAINTDGTSVATGANDWYIRLWFYAATLPATEENCFGFETSGGAAKLYFTILNSGLLKAYDAASAVVGTSTTALTAGNWYSLQAHCGTSATVGAIELKINGAVEISTTSNTSATSNAVLKVGKIGNKNSDSVDWYYDDLTISNAAYPSATGVIKVIKPTANGSTMQWTAGTGASDYTQVNEIPVSDAEYVASVSSGDVALFAMTDTATANIAGSINVLKGYIRARENATGTSANAIRIRSSGTNSDSGNFNGSTTVAVQCRLLANDPATSAAWTLSGIDGVEIGSVENATVVMRCTSVLGMVDYTPPGNPGRRTVIIQ